MKLMVSTPSFPASHALFLLRLPKKFETMTEDLPPQIETSTVMLPYLNDFH